jgi:hypothetical protein
MPLRVAVGAPHPVNSPIPIWAIRNPAGVGGMSFKQVQPDWGRLCTTCALLAACQRIENGSKRLVGKYL